MIKYCLKSLLSLILLIGIFNFHSIAASLSLTNIGGLATSGARYSEWWYTQTNPVLRGTATANSDVKITVGSTESTVKADSQGNWSFNSTMASGDHNVVISSGSESYSFTVHAGQNMPASTTDKGGTAQTTGSTPDTGSHQLLGIVSSVTLIGAGFLIYIRNKQNNKRAYVKSVLKSVK